MIIATRGDAIPEGSFMGNNVVIGGSRDECLAALVMTSAFAQDVGASLRNDGVSIYTMIGGAFLGD